MTLLLVALLLCYIDRTIISVAAIEMQKELGWSDSQKGYVLSMFSAGYLVMQLLGGLLSNRFGGRNVYFVAVFAWSLVTILTPSAAYASFGALIAARVLLGLGEGSAYPAAYNVIHGWMPVAERARSVGLLASASAVGTVFALLVSGKLIELYGWPSLFYVFGAIGLLWCPVWLAKVPARGPLEQHSVEQQTATKRSIPWKLLLLHPAVLTLYVVNFGVYSVTFLMASWLPSYFVDTFGSTTTQAGLYAIAPWVALSAVTYMAGAYSDACTRRGVASLVLKKRMMLVGLGLIIFSFALLTLELKLWMAIALVVTIFVGFGVAIPAISTIPGELLPRHGDILFGFLSGSGAIGSILFVAGAGILLDITGSYDAIFTVMAVASAISLVAFQLFATVDAIDRAESE
jgi:MFS family permease